MSFLKKFYFVLLCAYISVVNTKIWKHQGRIVGGSSAVERQFPYQLSLRIKENDAHFGGGVILNSRYIITAAHCFFNLPNHTDYFYGAINMTRVKDPVTRIEFETLIFHPQYGLTGPTPDISLIRTGQPIVFSALVKPINLPTQAFIADGILALVSGWGLSKVTVLFKNFFSTTSSDILIRRLITAPKNSNSQQPYSLRKHQPFHCRNALMTLNR